MNTSVSGEDTLCDEGQKNLEEQTQGPNNLSENTTSSSSESPNEPCAICYDTVRDEHNATGCDRCNHWFHAACLERTHALPHNEVLPRENIHVLHGEKLFQKLNTMPQFSESFPFFCQQCNVDNLPLPVLLYNKKLLNIKQMVEIGVWPKEFDLNEYLTIHNQRVDPVDTDLGGGSVSGQTPDLISPIHTVNLEEIPKPVMGGSKPNGAVDLSQSRKHIPKSVSNSPGEAQTSPLSESCMDHLKNKTHDDLIQELLRVTPLQNQKSEKPSARKRLNLNVQLTTVDTHGDKPSTSNTGTLTRPKEGGSDVRVNDKNILDVGNKENVHVDGIPSHATHNLMLNPLMNGRPTQENDLKRPWSAPTSTQSKTEQVDQLTQN